MKLFLSIFGLTFLAELPDKTAFAALMLATRRVPAAVFLGACAAFVIHAALAVAFGGALALLPAALVRYGAAALFLAMSAKLAFFDAPEQAEAAAVSISEEAGRFWRDAGDAFLIVFAAEWGDLTQFSTAAFAAKFHAPVTVFAAASLGLCAVAGLAVVLGERLKSALKPETLRRAAVVAFAGVGVALLVDALRRA